MEDLLQFLKLYGIMIFACSLVLLYVAQTARANARLRSIEQRMKDLEQTLVLRINEEEAKRAENADRQRRILNENLQNLNESVTRVIIQQKKQD